MLPEPQREILMLREFENLTYEEIADVMDISLSNVRVLLHRARNLFRRQYGANLLVEDAEQPCDELNELLDALHDGGPLTNAEHKRINKHLQDCPTCQQRQRELVAIGALIAALPPFVPSRGAIRQMGEQVTTPTGPAASLQPSGWIGKVSPLAILIAVVIGIVLSIMLYSGNPWDYSPPDETVEPVGACGDGICDSSIETELGCPEDCLPAPILLTPNEQGGDQPACVCGDGVCDPACENTDLCAGDCLCIDDGICQPGEDSSCRDCIAGGQGSSSEPSSGSEAACTCGDGVCDPACENTDLCAGDCPCIDDGVCQPGEGSSCRDCGAGEPGSGSEPSGGSEPTCICGNGSCESSCGEDRITCPGDCS